MLDKIISQLLEVRHQRPGKQVQLEEQEIKFLCLTSRDIFMKQPNLLELEAPIKICGKENVVLPLISVRSIWSLSLQNALPFTVRAMYYKRF